MSHSDKDDFEKDPFEENGKRNDSGKSGDEPSFDDLFGNLDSSGSESPDFPDFGGEASEPHLSSPDGGDDAGGGDNAGEDFFDSLLSGGGAPQKDDTLAGLAGLEDLFGGKKDSGEDAGEDAASRPDAPEPEEDARTPSDEPDFDFDFSDSAGSETPSADEPEGVPDLDFDLSSLPNTEEPDAGPDLDFDLGSLPNTEEPKDGVQGEPLDLDFSGLDGEDAADSPDAGSDAPSAEGADADLDFDFGGLGGEGMGDSEPFAGDFSNDTPTGGDTASSLSGLTMETDGDGGLDTDFFKSLEEAGGGEEAFPSAEAGALSENASDPGGEGAEDAFDFSRGADDDFLKDLEAPESTPESPSPVSGIDFSDSSEGSSAGEGDELSLDDLLGGIPAGGGADAGLPGLTAETDGDGGLDTDFFKSLEGTGGGEEALPNLEESESTPESPSSVSGIDFSDSPEGSSAGDGDELSLDDLLGGVSADSSSEGEPSFDGLAGEGGAAPDDTAARLGSLQNMFGGDAAEDTAARLARFSAESGGEENLDSDFFADEAEREGGGVETSRAADGEVPADEGEDVVDTKTESTGAVPADSGKDADFPTFDDEEGDGFAALNTGDSPEGESTTAALAGFEGLVSSDGPAAGEDTAAFLGALTGAGEPAKDESTTAGLAGLEGLLGSGGDQREETAVRLSRLAEEDEESPDEQTLEDFLDSETTAGDSETPDGGSGDADIDDLLGGGANDGFGDTGGFSEFGGEFGGMGEAGEFSEFGGESEEGAEEAPEEDGDAEAETGKKKKSKAGKKEKPKKKKSRRRRKEELNDPVSKLLTVPQVFFILYLILGNVKGFLEWHRSGEFFTLPFFLLAFNGTGAVLLLLPALLRAFRKRYAEDSKLTEYTLFMFMLALSVAAMIMACHPLIFDLARNWGGPH